MEGEEEEEDNDDDFWSNKQNGKSRNTHRRSSSTPAYICACFHVLKGVGKGDGEEEEDNDDDTTNTHTRKSSSTHAHTYCVCLHPEKEWKNVEKYGHKKKEQTPNILLKENGAPCLPLSLALASDQIRFSSVHNFF